MGCTVTERDIGVCGTCEYVCVALTSKELCLVGSAIKPLDPLDLTLDRVRSDPPSSTFSGFAEQHDASSEAPVSGPTRDGM